ncbi:MAG: hypothetical protein JWQ71_4741 [Pedosphaera sp.]|nr:hypothetical protein [Pedosphaera sp.]
MRLCYPIKKTKSTSLWKNQPLSHSPTHLPHRIRQDCSFENENTSKPLTFLVVDGIDDERISRLSSNFSLHSAPRTPNSALGSTPICSHQVVPARTYSHLLFHLPFCALWVLSRPIPFPTSGILCPFRGHPPSWRLCALVVPHSPSWPLASFADQPSFNPEFPSYPATHREPRNISSSHQVILARTGSNPLPRRSSRRQEALTSPFCTYYFF